MHPVPSITGKASQCLVKNFALAGHTDNIERCYCPHLLSTTRALAVTNPRARENSAAGPACHGKLIFRFSYRYNCSVISCNSHGLHTPTLGVLIIESRNVTTEFGYKGMPCLG